MAFPTMNAYEEASKISASLVDEVRTKFLEMVDKKPDLYYVEDIERIKSNDWSVRRFLFIQKSNADKAVENMDRAMKWRKEFGVRQLTDKDFPKELFQSAAVILYGKDLNGAQLMIMRAKTGRKIKSWVPTAHKFLVYLVEKVDLADTGKGMTLLLDCKNSGVKNADIDYLKFSHQVFNDYYPGLVNAGVIYKLPKVMEAVYKVVKTWLDEEQNKYGYLCGKKNVNQYVSVQELPDFMLGLNPEPYRTVPDGAPSAQELAEKLSLKPEKADKLVKHLELFYTE